jgi:ketosteroid isomerase-like protein
MPTRTDIDDSIQTVASRLAIEELNIGYCLSIDARDVDAFLSWWSEDAVWSMPFASFSGHEAIRQAFEAIVQSVVATRHLSGNLAISLDGDHATARSYCFYESIGLDGTASTGWASYRDEFVRNDGQWRFLRRDVSLDELSPLATAPR